MTAFDDDSGVGARPIYSIGAIASMLGVETATLRAWEERYGVVVPTRSEGGQRIYSRDELEQLRFLVDELEGGATAADAHRLLAGRLHGAGSLSRPDPDGVTIVVLLAERDRYAAELLEYFLRTEGYDVCAAFDPTLAEQMFADRRPQLSVVDLAGAALAAGASAFLPKPVVPLEFVSTVRDLLGSSALTRPSRETVS